MTILVGYTIVQICGFERRNHIVFFKKEQEFTMRLGTRSRYAVMAILDLARYFQIRPVALSEIAMRQEISLQYLEQIFVKLKRAGVVSSVRGVHGGYSLVKAPQLLNIAEIVEAIEQPFKATRCHSSKSCLDKTNVRCISHVLWEKLSQNVNGFLENVSVQDVLTGFGTEGSLCLSSSRR